MEILHPRCGGLDVHQQTVVACARVVAGSSVAHDVRTFGTTTPELLALGDWLAAHGCTHVAMESTGVYWKSVWHVLEGVLSWSSPTPCTSGIFPAAKVTSTTPPGSPTSWPMASSGGALSPPPPSNTPADPTRLPTRPSPHLSPHP